MNYATGRHMAQPVFSGAFEVEDVVGMVRSTYAGRVRFHDGDAEIAPGVSLHLIGGHTMGLQVVRVATRRGWVVLASDASHFYANMEQVRPFPIVYSVADMVEGYARLRALADSPGAHHSGARPAGAGALSRPLDRRCRASWRGWTSRSRGRLPCGIALSAPKGVTYRRVVGTNPATGSRSGRPGPPIVQQRGRCASTESQSPFPSPSPPPSARARARRRRR